MEESLDIHWHRPLPKGSKPSSVTISKDCANRYFVSILVEEEITPKKKGSKNRNKARLKVAKIYARICDRRRDYQHKLSRRIVNENQVMCVESLAVKNMVHNPKLAKAISDVEWGEFVRQLEYKSRWYGRTLVKIDRFSPSSKTCSACKHVLDSLPLDIREWVCPECGVVHDRDTNAALNILAEGHAAGGLWRECKTRSSKGSSGNSHLSSS
jgi:putative transposase